MKTGYFILGMHRSGTSALGGVLDIMGLEFGSNLMPPHEENPKGYFENNFVVRLNEKILNKNNSSWNDKDFDIAMLSKESIKKYAEEAKEIIDSEFKYAQKFVIKDPRICLLFPIWEMACKELNIEIKTILPYRNPMEVATSLQKRNAFPIEKGLLLWMKHFLSAEYFSRKYPRMFLSFDDLLSQTKKTVDGLYIFTGFKGQRKRKDIDGFLDKNIKHNNIAIENFTKEIPRFFQELLDILQTKKFDNLDLFDIIRHDYIYSQKLFQYNDKKHKKELEILIEKVRLLEQIKDVAVFDEEYYLKAYSDLSQYDGIPFHHYLNYGKTEKRKPNEYCAVFGIDTQGIVARDEENYALNEQLQNVQNINVEQSSTIESQNEKLQELQSTLNVVSEQKTQIEQEYQNKLQEIENLNQQLNEFVEDLVAVKESKEQLSQELNEQLQNVQNINVEQSSTIESQNEKLQELQSTLNAVSEQKTQIEQEYQNKLQEIENLNRQLKELVEDLIIVKELKAQLSVELNEKLQNLESINMRQKSEMENQRSRFIEVQGVLKIVENENLKLEQKSLELSQSIDAIVKDLVLIKESKCWIYTKPFRKMQKVVFKGNNNE